MKFTGKQITLMVVAVSAATILTPAAVNAATGSSVNITDPVYSANKARVTGGKLYVGDGYGPMTVDGLVKVTDGSGALTVDGSVAANDPTTTWSKVGDGIDNGSTIVTLRNVAANIGISLGSITLAHTAGTGSVTVHLRTLVPSATGVCTAGTVSDELMDFPLAQGEVKTITYAPGFRIRKISSETCLNVIVVGSSGTQTVNVSATGSTY